MIYIVANESEAYCYQKSINLLFPYLYVSVVSLQENSKAIFCMKKTYGDILLGAHNMYICIDYDA